MKSLDLSDKVFGMLKVIGFSHNYHRHRYWLCKCECGKEKVIAQDPLVIGRVISCGCSKKRIQNKHKSWTGYGEISGQYYNKIKVKALSRKQKRRFDVSIEYLWELFLKQERKCALTNLPLAFGSLKLKQNQTASLDRIDSSNGYIIGNVQWVHKDINWMKNDFDQEKFIEYCLLVAKKFNNY